LQVLPSRISAHVSNPLAAQSFDENQAPSRAERFQVFVWNLAVFSSALGKKILFDSNCAELERGQVVQQVRAFSDPPKYFLL
jgi:hypothetical protein